MLNCNPDPPETLASAAELFSRFLSEDGLPSRICWLTHSDVLIGCRDRRFLVHPRPEAGLQTAQIAYSLGLQQGLGIALTAMCASDEETFAHVVIPEDERDRQCRLMGNGLKLSHPSERSKTTVVLSDLRWTILVSRYSERSNVLWS